MDRSIKEMIFLSVEILLIGILLTFVLCMRLPAKEAEYKKDIDTTVRAHLNEYRDLYKFDNKYVTGEDIIYIMQKYKSTYAYYVDVDEEVGKVLLSSRSAKRNKADWTSEGLKNFFLIDVVNTDIKVSYPASEIVSKLALKNSPDESKNFRTTIYKAYLIRIPIDVVETSGNISNTVVNNISNYTYLNQVGQTSSDGNIFKFSSSYLESLDNSAETEITGIVFERDKSFASARDFLVKE